MTTSDYRLLAEDALHLLVTGQPGREAARVVEVIALLRGGLPPTFDRNRERAVFTRDEVVELCASTAHAFHDNEVDAGGTDESATDIAARIVPERSSTEIGAEAVERAARALVAIMYPYDRNKLNGYDLYPGKYNEYARAILEAAGPAR